MCMIYLYVGEEERQWVSAFNSNNLKFSIATLMALLNSKMRLINFVGAVGT